MGGARTEKVMRNEPKYIFPAQSKIPLNEKVFLKKQKKKRG